MKLYVTALFILGFLFSCSPPETLTTEPDTEEEVVDESVPEWYNNTITSEADTVHFTGYALAIAADSAETHQQSIELATENLRFTIDKFVENIRVSLVSDDGRAEYESPGFIIDLRNSVRNLEFSDLDETVEYVQENNTHYVYSRIRLSREDAVNLLRRSLTDEAFNEALSR